MKKIFIAILVFFMVGYSEPLVDQNEKDYSRHYALLTEEEIDSINNLFILEHGFHMPWILDFPFIVESESEPENVLLQIAGGSDALDWIILLDTVLSNGVYDYRLKDDEIPFGSGMYFYRFQIGDTTIVRKITIIR